MSLFIAAYPSHVQVVKYYCPQVNAAMFIVAGGCDLGRRGVGVYKQNSRSVSVVSQNRVATADYFQCSHLTNSFKEAV